jgi:hypothetical protein
MKIMEDFCSSMIQNIRNGKDSNQFNILRLAIDRAKNNNSIISDVELRDIVRIYFFIFVRVFLQIIDFPFFSDFLSFLADCLFVCLFVHLFSLWSRQPQ